MTGRFITLEGGDGAGKTTQAELLSAWLGAHGRTVVRTREPGGTDLGVQIRQMVLHERGHVAPRAEALLYAADRAQHVETIVRPAIARGEVVLQDRYIDSSVAYQGVARGLGAEQVRSVSEWAADGLAPDLTILLDLDVTVGRARVAAARGTPSTASSPRPRRSTSPSVRPSSRWRRPSRHVSWWSTPRTRPTPYRTRSVERSPRSSGSTRHDGGH